MKRLVLLLALAGCRPPPPGPLPPSDGLGAPFLARQKVVVTQGGQPPRSLDVVLQYDGHELLLLGLTPMGTKAFAVHQRGRDVRLETFVAMGLAVPPVEVLRDIHRASFTPTGPVHHDGWQRIADPGAAPREGGTPRNGRKPPLWQLWRAGGVVERIYGARSRRDSLRISYARPLVPHAGATSDVIELDHPALALHLSIHTLSRTALPPVAH
jgi:hypothetical protein